MFFIYLHILMPLPPCLLLLADTLTHSQWHCCWAAVTVLGHTYLQTATHIWGIFYSFLAWTVSLSLIHSLSHILQICHSFFLMIFATYYSTLTLLHLQVEGLLSNWAFPEWNWASDHSLWKNLVGKSAITGVLCSHSLHKWNKLYSGEWLPRGTLLYIFVNIQLTESQSTTVTCQAPLARWPAVVSTTHPINKQNGWMYYMYILDNCGLPNIYSSFWPGMLACMGKSLQSFNSLLQPRSSSGPVVSPSLVSLQL